MVDRLTVVITVRWMIIEQAVNFTETSSDRFEDRSELLVSWIALWVCYSELELRCIVLLPGRLPRKCLVCYTFCNSSQHIYF
jgi:hypothetical protein